MSEESQLRKHLVFEKEHLDRQNDWRDKLKHLGENVHIDKNVEFMRFPENIHVSDNVVVKEGARICSCNDGAQISIGKNTTFGYHSFLFASDSIEIGDDCLIAPFVYLVDSDHEIARDQLINQQQNSVAPVKVGNDVWIGTGAKVLKGVTIEDGAVIAAGAIVTDRVGAYEIWGGIPAKKISERK